jgi:hypothetical protein
MTDIKELALKTLGAMAEDGFHVYIITYEAGNERFELDAPALDEYNKRLIAAYLAEQEPRGWWNPSYPAAIFTSGAKIRWGNAEMLNELSVSLLADQLGYKVVPK